MEHSTYSSRILTPKDRLMSPRVRSPIAVNMLPRYSRPKEKVVVVMGPTGTGTGTGKSRLTLELATRSPAEIINSNKMQVYRGLDIVTNKVTEDEKRGVTASSTGGNGGNGKFPSGGGGGGEEEAWEVLDLFARVMEEQEESGEPLGLLYCLNPIILDRTLADRGFLYKLLVYSRMDILAQFRKSLADLLLGNVPLLDFFASYAPSGQLAFAALPRSAFGADWSVSEFPLKQKIFEYLFKAGVDGASKVAWSACKLAAKRIVASHFCKGVLFGFALGIGCKHAAKLVAATKAVPPDLMAALLGGALVVALNRIPETMKEASPMNPRAAVEEERTTRPVAMKLVAGLRFPNHIYDYVVQCNHTQSHMITGSSVNFFADRSWFVVLCLSF